MKNIILSVLFSFCFLPYALRFSVSDFTSWISDFGGNPSRAFRRVASLFWDARIISGCPKHNLLCSLEHEFAWSQIEFWPSASFFGFGITPSGIHSVVGGKVTAVYLPIKQHVICNKMSYDDKGRHRLRMMAIIRENPFLFAVRTVATGLLIAE